MIVITDPTDTELPIENDMVVNIIESKDLFFALLDSLNSMFINN